MNFDGKFYQPTEEIIENANIKKWDELNKIATNHPEGFWSSMANELHWFQKWDKYLDSSNKPFFKFFVNGKTNIAYNCLDVHIKSFRRNKLAYIWEGEDGSVRTISYNKLYTEVCKFANVLKSLNVQKGDRVTIYMGRVPEIAVAMLACARIGAVHSVVYGGFSTEALYERIEDSQSKVVITCDGAFQRGKIVKLKEICDEAVDKAGIVEHVICVKRTGEDVNMLAGRDFWYHDLMSLPLAKVKCEAEVLDAEDPLYILYTSGTTGKPKAILHTHGGYMVGVYTSFKYVLDIHDEDRYWCTADAGWVTGHSYVVYGPLLNGATSVMYEGAPNYPYPDRWWSIIEKYGVNIFYTAPTAVRGLMRFGNAWVNKHDLSSLRLLGSVGEPINPEAWKWYYEAIGNSKCPIMDTWWQTETGMFMITPFPCMPLKPGSGTKPFPGVLMDILDDDGNPVDDNQEGFLVVKNPWPAMMRTIYQDDERYVNQYWSKYPDYYMTGDSAKRDEDGYYWVIGRVDDVIKVSGYRLGSVEIESALVSCPDVAEAAAIGLPHDIKGNAIHCFVMLKDGINQSEELIERLKQQVRHEVGPIATPESIEFVDKLPKTRSGKIMRRVLKSQVLGVDPGNITTLED